MSSLTAAAAAQSTPAIYASRTTHAHADASDTIIIRLNAHAPTHPQHRTHKHAAAAAAARRSLDLWIDSR